MEATPFLTLIDPSAAVKGSRDPLGVQAIWARLGRRVIGNLTTVSSSLRDFAVTLVGYALAEELYAEGAASELDVFLRWEQIAAYARAICLGERAGLRGTERVWRRREDGRAALGQSASAQILSKQKVYGLWGLFTNPAKASGLLAGDPTRVTTEGRKVTDSFLGLVHRTIPSARAALSRKLEGKVSSLDLTEGGKDYALLQAIAKALKQQRPVESDVYRTHLVEGGPQDEGEAGTQGQQRLLAALLRQEGSDFTLSPQVVERLSVRARKHKHVGERLADNLAGIRTVEQVLAPAAALFDYLLTQEGQRRARIAEDVRSHWGKNLRLIDVAAFEGMKTPLGDGDVDAAERWVNVARALHDGEYEGAINELVSINAETMKARGQSAAWISLEGGKLRTRVEGSGANDLPDRRDLPALWRHPYFLPSLHRITHEVGA